MRTTVSRIVSLGLAAAVTVSCGQRSGLQRLWEARQLSADLLVQFTKAADAANKAVMADTDEASIIFARQAGEARQAVQTNVDALQPILKGLGYADETRVLEDFVARFAEYRDLDRRILDLAVENTNLKAQRLSFGPAREAADALRDGLEGLVPRDGATETWHVKALSATAVAAVSDIQARQAPHIAEPDEAVMTRLEAGMAASETAARRALEALAPLIAAASRPRLEAAQAALDRFMAVHAEITALSRRNTNVRSLALTLNEKGELSRACENHLRALREALAKRGLSGAR